MEKMQKNKNNNPYDETIYWDWIQRYTDKRDLGHSCRECKNPFKSLNEKIAIRRGGRIELRYHTECFSGHADPRSQNNSSYSSGKYGKITSIAPKGLYNKMRTSSHF